MAIGPFYCIDIFPGGNEICSPGIGARYVYLVVFCVEGMIFIIGFIIVYHPGIFIQMLKFFFPDCSASIHVTCAYAVDSLNNKPAVYDLF